MNLRLPFYQRWVLYRAELPRQESWLQVTTWTYVICFTQTNLDGAKGRGRTYTSKLVDLILPWHGAGGRTCTSIISTYLLYRGGADALLVELPRQGELL